MINKKENFLIKKSLKINILNKFISICITELLDEYLNKYVFCKNNIPEIILKYLDNLIYLMQLENKFSISHKLFKLSNREKIKIEKALKKSMKIKPLFEKLNILFNIIKNEELQDEVFIHLFNNFEEYNNKITENNENNEKTINHFNVDIKNKIKELINNNHKSQLNYYYK